MPHPHGQIYAMPFVSPVVEKELESAAEYRTSFGGVSVLRHPCRRVASVAPHCSERAFRRVCALCRTLPGRSINLRAPSRALPA